MRILICNKYNFGFSGTEVYLGELKKQLRRRGHVVAEFAMADERNEASRWAEHFVSHADFRAKGSGLAEKVRLAGRAVWSREARKKVGRVVEEFRPDVAHVRNIYHHISPSVLWELRRRGVGVVYHLNDFKMICPSYNLISRGRVCEKCAGGKFWNVAAEGCHGSGMSGGMVLAAEAYLHKWVGTFRRCVDRFVAPSEFVKRKLVENGWEAGRIEVLAHFEEAGEGPAEMAESGYVLCCGRLSREKGVRELLEAMGELREVPLVIAGDGPQRAELEEMARGMGLGRVTFTGQVSSAVVRELMRGARFTVMASLAYETMGKTILESYAAGRAVVATDLGSRREVVDDGVTGILCAAGDVAELREKIRWLWERPEVAREMGAAGWRKVKERHGVGEHVERMVGIYEAVREEKKEKMKRGERRDRKDEGAEKGISGKRVAFIGGRGVGGNYGGIEVFYEEAGRELVGRGHEVTAYCRSYYTAAEAEWGGMRVVRHGTVRRKHWETLVHTARATVAAMFGRHDVVHYHALGPGIFAWLPRVMGKRTVVTVQGLDWKRGKWGRLARACLQLAERFAVWGPTKTVVVTRELQRYFLKKYGRETEYVPNGVRLNGKRRAEGKYVLYMGRISEEKRIEDLVEAFCGAGGEWKLVIAGEEVYGSGYGEELRNRAAANARVKFAGWVAGAEKEELLENAGIFVLASEVEGMSLALLEAMACGVCVVVSDIAENREAVGDAGILFRCGDAGDLREKLEEVMRDAGLRREMGAKARARVEREYSWERVAEGLEGVYGGDEGW